MRPLEYQYNRSKKKSKHYHITWKNTLLSKTKFKFITRNTGLNFFAGDNSQQQRIVSFSKNTLTNHLPSWLSTSPLDISLLDL